MKVLLDVLENSGPRRHSIGKNIQPLAESQMFFTQLSLDAARFRNKKGLEKLGKIIFPNNERSIMDRSTTADDIEDWDSIEHINLVIAMEKKFDLKFNIREVGKLANVGEMVDLIVSMLENKNS